MDLSLLTDRLALALGTACYAAGLLYGAWSLLYRRRHSRLTSYAAVLAGWTLQTLGLFLRGNATHSCPLGNKFEILQFVVWSFSFLYLVVGPAFRLSVLGFFSAAMATVLGSASLAVPAWDSVHRTRVFGANPWIEFHAALAVFSYGVFGLLALTSLMYLLQLRNLQRKRLAGLFRFLPSILDLDHMNRRLLVVGLGLLSIALGVGGVLHVAEPGSVSPAKLMVTTAVWLAYALALVQRLRQRLANRRFAAVCLALFGVALASLWPVNASRPPVPPAPATDRAP